MRAKVAIDRGVRSAERAGNVDHVCLRLTKATHMGARGIEDPLSKRPSAKSGLMHRSKISRYSITSLALASNV
jgi:hypothetical protein